MTFDRTEMTQTIEQLTARVAELEKDLLKTKLDLLTSYGESEELSGRIAELEAENARLKAECDDIKQVQFPRKLEAVAVGWKKRLAAEQLNNKLLREALRGLDDYCDPANNTSFCECDPTVGYQCAVCHWPRIQEVAEARAALSTPASTEALDRYVEEKVKECN